MIVVFTSLSFFVLVAGLLIYFFCAGAISKATILPISKTMIFCGLLAFLMVSGSQSCSSSSGASSATPAKK